MLVDSRAVFPAAAAGEMTSAACEAGAATETAAVPASASTVDVACPAAHTGEVADVLTTAGGLGPDCAR